MNVVDDLFLRSFPEIELSVYDCVDVVQITGKITVTLEEKK